MFVCSAVLVALSFGSMPRQTHSSLVYSAARARVKYPMSFTYLFARKCLIWSATRTGKHIQLHGTYVTQRKTYT